jgi:transketolase
MILNNALHLTTGETKKTTRDGVGEGLLYLGKNNPQVLVLTADLADSTRSLEFGKTFPEKYFNVGVAEQNMAGVAAGLALDGKIPFIASFGVFSPGRNWDQVRVSICYSKANVKIISSHTGLSAAQDGATHQALEDIAITRVLPNMCVIAPADAIEARKAIIVAAEYVGPLYIRYEKNDVPIYTTDDTPFVIGQGYQYIEGSDVTIASTGQTLQLALGAAQDLEMQGISAEVLHFPTIKPLDKKLLLESIAKTRCLVSVEEHQVSGGFGGVLAEAVVTNDPIPMHMIGMQNTFAESGPFDALAQKYGITKENVRLAALDVIKRKKA